MFAEAAGRGFSVELGAGDALLIPRWWWHQTSALSDGHALNWWFELSTLEPETSVSTAVPTVTSIDVSNLNRQFLFRKHSVEKVDALISAMADEAGFEPGWSWGDPPKPCRDQPCYGPPSIDSEEDEERRKEEAELQRRLDLLRSGAAVVED